MALTADKATLRYLVLSVASLGVVLAVTNGLERLAGVRVELAYAIALVVAMCVNFLSMRYLVFGRPTMPIGQQFVAFVLRSIGFRVAEWGAFTLIHAYFGRYYSIAVIIVQGVSFVAKYFLDRFLLFERKKRTPSSPGEGGPGPRR